MDGNWDSERTPADIAAGRRYVGWTRFGYALSVVALAALGVLWHLDRTRRWETPRWDPAEFERIESAADADDIDPAAPSGAPAADDGETWVVAVQPSCPHCRASLAALLARRAREHLPVRIEALIVDVCVPPASTLARELGCDAAWWDARGVWRGRWGHRVYGETFCFGADGALLRVEPPSASPSMAASN